MQNSTPKTCIDHRAASAATGREIWAQDQLDRVERRRDKDRDEQASLRMRNARAQEYLYRKECQRASDDAARTLQIPHTISLIGIAAAGAIIVLTTLVA